MRGIGLVMGILLVLTGLARAEEDAASKAKALYERGMAHYQLGEYDDAVKSWQEGFRVKPVPEFLYNIGQAYRLSDHPEKAIQAYQAFLRMAPKSPNRSEVERHIATLQPLVEQRRREAAAAPPPTEKPPQVEHAPEPRPTAPTVPTTAPVAEPSTSATTSADAALVKAPPKKPLYKRGWFWGAIVGGAVVVAGAVTLGVVLGTRTTTATLPGLNY